MTVALPESFLEFKGPRPGESTDQAIVRMARELRDLFDGVQRNFEEISVQPDVPQATEVTSLPADPYDGQEVVYVDGPAVWELRYRADSPNTHKWDVLGATPTWKRADSTVSTFNTSFTDLDATTPSFTVPRAGLYEVTFGAQMQSSAGDGAAMAPWHNGGTINVADECFVGGSGSQNVFSMRTVQLTLNATSTIKLQYRSSAGLLATFLRRFLMVRPIRVN